jgi:DEAD/DEAH box helicase domain-containing protein
LNESKNFEVIGEVDYFSAPIFLHPEAIYLHGAEQYQVTKLDWEGRKAYVKEVDVDYFTDAETKTDLKVLSTEDEKTTIDGAKAYHGEITLTSTTVLFKKVKFHTHENVGWGELKMPEIEMHTNAFWYTFPGDVFLKVGVERPDFGGALRGLANILGKIAPLWVMCDSRDLRSISQVRAPFSEQPTVYVYENIPGGVGLSRKLFAESDKLFEACLEHVRKCPCPAGCPSCTGPSLEVGDHGKPGVLRLLEYMLAVEAV